jgi:hypothetical protein
MVYRPYVPRTVITIDVPAGKALAMQQLIHQYGAIHTPEDGQVVALPLYDLADLLATQNVAVQN